MTNDELERIMNFIIERQETFAEQLTQAQTIVTVLAARQENHDERIARFERSYTVIAEMLGKHDTQIEAVTEGLNNLIATVNRYIAARGDGSNASGGA